MENRENPLEVTVLMSVYHESKEYLKQAMDSILNQTYHDFEFLIIDDGNNQDLVALVEEYQDSRIRLIHNEKNLGLEKSLNKGLGLAKGKYLVRMDADDIAYVDRIEKQVSFVKDNPQYAIVSGNVEIFDENGVYGTTKNAGEKTKYDLVKETPFVHPTMLIQKEALQTIGGYPSYHRCEDYAMAMEMYVQGYLGFVMKDILLKYRMNADGYQKKKYKNRVIEAKVRWDYFRKLHVKWYQYIFVLKPLMVGLIPKKLLKKIHEKRFG